MVGIQRISGKKPGKGGVMGYDFIFFSSALLRRFLIFENWILRMILTGAGTIGVICGGAM